MFLLIHILGRGLRMRSVCNRRTIWYWWWWRWWWWWYCDVQRASNYDVVTLTSPWSRIDLSQRCVGETTSRRQIAVVYRNNCTSSTNLDEWSRWRIGFAAIGLSHHAVGLLRHRHPQPSSSSPTSLYRLVAYLPVGILVARLTSTTMNAQDSRMIERRKHESQKADHNTLYEPRLRTQ